MLLVQMAAKLFLVVRRKQRTNLAKRLKVLLHMWLSLQKQQLQKLQLQKQQRQKQELMLAPAVAVSLPGLQKRNGLARRLRALWRLWTLKAPMILSLNRVMSRHRSMPCWT